MESIIVSKLRVKDKMHNSFRRWIFKTYLTPKRKFTEGDKINTLREAFSSGWRSSTRSAIIKKDKSDGRT